MNPRRFARPTLVALVGLLSGCGGGRPCTGPCDYGISDAIPLAIVALLGLGVIVATYVTVRMLPGARQSGSRIVPLGLALALVAVTALITNFVRDQLELHAWPTVIVGQRGLHPSDPFPLGGHYAVEWQAIAGNGACTLNATLHRADDDTFARDLVSTSIPPRTNTGSSTALMDFERDRYYVEASSACEGWSVTFTPRTGP